MAVFILNTDEVNSISNTIDNLAAELSSLANQFSSYDTSCDEFDFTSAKQTIASNIDACHQKVKNTALFMKETVSAHTALQTSNMTANNTNEQSENNQSNNNYSYSSSRGTSSSYHGTAVTGSTGATITTTAATPVITVQREEENSETATDNQIETLTSDTAIEEQNQELSATTIVNQALTYLEETSATAIEEQFLTEDSTSWCSEFINWCASTSGYENSTVLPTFKTAEEGVKFFTSQSQFQTENYSPSIGDVVFFDNDNDNIADHIGIITKSEGNKIYTIESTNNKEMTQKTYESANKNIIGYGTPNYKDLIVRKNQNLSQI